MSDVTHTTEMLMRVIDNKYEGLSVEDKQILYNIILGRDIAFKDDHGGLIVSTMSSTISESAAAEYKRQLTMLTERIKKAAENKNKTAEQVSDYIINDMSIVKKLQDKIIAEEKQKKVIDFSAIEDDILKSELAHKVDDNKKMYFIAGRCNGRTEIANGVIKEMQRMQSSVNNLHAEPIKTPFLNPEDVKCLMRPEDVKHISDGYHTFEELYDHRTKLFAVICTCFQKIAWKSKLHDDGSMYDGMFIVGINTCDGPATYHCEMKYWELFDVVELQSAPIWDGHTPSDAIERILSLVM